MIRRWRQLTAAMHGTNRKKSGTSIKSSQRETKAGQNFGVGNAGYGGHFRAVLGFRYYGQKGLAGA